MANITIIGGHGKVALQLAPLLVDDDANVTAWVRKAEQVPDVDGTGAHGLVADVEQMDVDAIVEDLKGQDAVVWLAGAGGGSPERTKAVDQDAAIRSMDAAEKAGVKRYIMVSYFYNEPHNVPKDNDFYAYAEAKQNADKHLRGTELDWTIVGPSALTDDPGTGKIDLNPNEVKSVSRADVAAVVAAVVRTPNTVHQTLHFNSGDTPITEALNSLK